MNYYCPQCPCCHFRSPFHSLTLCQSLSLTPQLIKILQTKVLKSRLESGLLKLENWFRGWNQDSRILSLVLRLYNQKGSLWLRLSRESLLISERRLVKILWTELFSTHRPSGPMLSISQNVHICVCLSVCLFTFEVPFNGLFAPTSQSRMSNIFRDSESLGKSYGKKWSHIWTF